MRLLARIRWVISVAIRPDHLKFFNNFKSLRHVERQWFKALVNKNFALLPDLTLSDQIEIYERLVKKSRDVLYFLEDLGVVGDFNELDKFFEDLLYRS